MIKRILIANRGEIAVRIICACKELGIETVALYSEADKEALHKQYADIALCIGPASAKESYLKISNIINACMLTKSDAIHPGYGFLSESSRFAKICEECGIILIGPSSQVIELMGNKLKAKQFVKETGIAIIEGYDQIIENLEQGRQVAKQIGYPIVIKSVFGGGGKGMRVIHNEKEFDRYYKVVQTEAKVNFAESEIYIEKYIENPKHIEFQVLADEHGHVVHLGERECSLQIHNQKVLEEAPSIFLDEKTRQRMADAVLKIAKAVNYRNAGTIEFLVDKNKNFYFMEMNTRIQVEHPVTEMATGIDLVKEQIRIASGVKLSYKQKDIQIRGHALECRISIQHPKSKNDCLNKIKYLYLPSGFGVRTDSCLYQGYKVPYHYDAMVAKIIVWEKNRIEAINKMKRVLDEVRIDGVQTNVDMHKWLINKQKFVAGDYDTCYLSGSYIGVGL